MSTYKKASKEVLDRADAIIHENYPGLEAVGVRVDFLFAYAPVDKDDQPKGPAIKHHGCPAAGKCRVVALKDRVKGHGDAEILLDGDQWPKWSLQRRNAIIDHELCHIQVVPDGNSGLVKTDDIGRPKIRMRPHNFEFGWFTEIAERHGRSSLEVEQANRIKRTAGKIYFQPELFESVEMPEKEVEAATA